MYVVTSAVMKQAEAACVEREGITYLELMERAGTACAEKILRRTDAKNVLILCGKGKNGGDGFVIARKLFEAGRYVTVMLTCGEPKAEDAVTNFNRLDPYSVNVIRFGGINENIRRLIESADAIVECIFGTGFKGVLDPVLTSLAVCVNSRSNASPLFAVDVPAGADAELETAPGTAFKATHTFAVSAFKKIHVIKPYNTLCGDVCTVDIGIFDEEHSGAGLITGSVSDAAALLPERPTVSNKGTFGHALCICGSMRMQGAAVLAATGALRMGAGLVTSAFPEKAYPAIASKLTEPLMLPLPCDEKGFFTLDALPELLTASEKATAVLIGCGFGLTDDTVKLVCELLKAIKKPVILDADGINAAAKNINILKEAAGNLILTPHPGEMSRLFGVTVGEVVAQPEKYAKALSENYGVTAVLKTANTLVSSPGKPMYINTTGCSALAKGGSGDLLAGMITALCAQGLSPFDAARAAVCLHGHCADKAAEKADPRGLLPTDIALELLNSF